jgi:glutamyl-tRNA(Gln) amidotransferase subunit E
MYPDTDSEPIPVTTQMIEELGRDVPKDISFRFKQMKEWGIPDDAMHYLLKKNLVVMIERISEDFGFDPGEVGTLLGHRFRNLEGRKLTAPGFSYETLYNLFAFIKEKDLLPEIAKAMLPDAVASAKPDFDIILTGTGYCKSTMAEINAQAIDLKKEFSKICFNGNGSSRATTDWIMGRVIQLALGNIRLSEVRNEVAAMVEISN